MGRGWTAIEQPAGSNEKHPDTHRHQQYSVTVPLTQRFSVTLKQLWGGCLSQARRNDHYPGAVITIGMAVEYH
ncbi:hypothetical protein D9M71_828400 [compost metagenome]